MTIITYIKCMLSFMLEYYFWIQNWFYINFYVFNFTLKKTQLILDLELILKWNNIVWQKNHLKTIFWTHKSENEVNTAPNKWIFGKKLNKNTLKKGKNTYISINQNNIFRNKYQISSNYHCCIFRQLHQIWVCT